MDTKINLRWTSHKSTVFSMFDTLLSTESMVDVTLACDGKYLRAHRVILSACSPYFQEIFGIAGNNVQSPILYMRGVKHSELEALIQYMYRGEVSVSHDQLASLLEIAKDLKIRGLSDAYDDNTVDSESTVPTSDSGRARDVIPSPPPLVRAVQPTIAITSPLRSEDLTTKASHPKKNHHRRQRWHHKTEPLPVLTASGHVSSDSMHAGSDTSAPDSQQHTFTSDPLGECPSLPRLQFNPKTTENDDENEQIRAFFHENEDDEEAKSLKLEVQEGYMREPEIVDLDDEDSVNESMWDHTSLAALAANSSMSIDESRMDDGDGARGSRSISDVSIVPRNKRSGVWQHFSTIASDEDDSELYSQCNYCYKKYKRNTSTTNMKAHLNVSHQIFY